MGISLPDASNGLDPFDHQLLQVRFIFGLHLGNDIGLTPAEVGCLDASDLRDLPRDFLSFAGFDADEHIGSHVPPPQLTFKHSDNAKIVPPFGINCSRGAHLLPQTVGEQTEYNSQCDPAQTPPKALSAWSNPAFPARHSHCLPIMVFCLVRCRAMTNSRRPHSNTQSAITSSCAATPSFPRLSRATAAALLRRIGRHRSCTQRQFGPRASPWPSPHVETLRTPSPHCTCSTPTDSAFTEISDSIPAACRVLPCFPERYFVTAPSPPPGSTLSQQKLRQRPQSGREEYKYSKAARGQTSGPARQGRARHRSSPPPT